MARLASELPSRGGIFNKARTLFIAADDKRLMILGKLRELRYLADLRGRSVDLNRGIALLADWGERSRANSQRALAEFKQRLLMSAQSIVTRADGSAELRSVDAKVRIPVMNSSPPL